MVVINLSFTRLTVSNYFYTMVLGEHTNIYQAKSKDTFFIIWFVFSCNQPKNHYKNNSKIIKKLITYKNITCNEKNNFNYFDFNLTIY